MSASNFILNRPEPRLPIREWAASVSVPLRTAQRWADEGRLVGSDADHPLAWQEGGRWYVAPHVYAPEPATPELAPDDLTALIDARVAAAFEAVAAQLRGA
ncbi:MAG TPA: hypothetical protein VNM48_02730 [Chloroflexota bacterium]|nr:hypothetical protein [Chloroflexota bacterium]